MNMDRRRNRNGEHTREGPHSVQALSKREIQSIVAWLHGGR